MSAAVARIRRGWRLQELWLLAFSGAILVLGLVSLELARQGEVGNQVWVHSAAFVGMLLVVHLWLNWRYPTSDQRLFPIAATLTAVGLVVVERLDPFLGPRQLAWLGIGLATMMVGLSLLPSVQWLRRWKYSSVFLGLALVAVTFVLGVDPNQSGARLWLGIGGVFFQPAELLKVLLVVFFAAYLHEKRELLVWGGLRWGPLHLPPLPYLAPLLLMLALSLAIVVLQRDLGPALLFFGIFLAMLYVTTGRASYVGLGLAGFLAGAALLYPLFPHVQLRVDIWLNPWLDADGGGYQIIQALVALASGGLLGSGLGFGYPTYIPAVHTDFVIAAIGEEMGLVGSLATVALYGLWLHRGLAIALASRDSFSALLAVGLTTAIALQAVVILGGVLRVIPLTGITLPFISYGGSSLLVNYWMLGVLLAVSSGRKAAAHA